MASIEFNREFIARVAVYAEVWQCDDDRQRRYRAQLCPYMINISGGDVGLLPPGQVVVVGSKGYEVYSELDELDPSRRGLAARTPEYRRLWAARPYFHSFDTARSVLVDWILNNRPDIVDVCASETRRAIAWRAASR